MKIRITTVATVIMGCIAVASGCQHNRGFVGGSCPGGACSAPGYATASPQTTYPSTNVYAAPSANAIDAGGGYAPPSNSGGSGTRSAPAFQGSGSR